MVGDKERERKKGGPGYVGKKEEETEKSKTPSSGLYFAFTEGILVSY